MGPKICFDPKSFGPNILKIFFGIKNFFGPKNFLEHKNTEFFWTQKFFRHKFFFTKKDLVWFYGINLPNQNCLKQRLSKLNTLDLSLVSQ